MTLSRLYTIPEVAAYLKVSRRTVYTLMQAGQLRYVQVGSLRRITERELELYLRTAGRAA